MTRGVNSPAAWGRVAGAARGDSRTRRRFNSGMPRYPTACGGHAVLFGTITPPERRDTVETRTDRDIWDAMGEMLDTLRALVKAAQRIVMAIFRSSEIADNALKLRTAARSGWHKPERAIRTTDKPIVMTWAASDMRKSTAATGE